MSYATTSNSSAIPVAEALQMEVTGFLRLVLSYGCVSVLWMCLSPILADLKPSNESSSSGHLVNNIACVLTILLCSAFLYLTSVACFMKPVKLEAIVPVKGMVSSTFLLHEQILEIIALSCFGWLGRNRGPQRPEQIWAEIEVL